MSESALFAATLKLSKKNPRYSGSILLTFPPPKINLAMITQWRRNFHDYLSSPNGSPTKTHHETHKWISSRSFLAPGLVPVNHVWAIPWTVPNRSRLPWRARRTMLKNKWPAKPKRPRARGQKWPAPTPGPLWEIESQWKTQSPYEISFSLLVEKVDLHALTQVERWGSAATRIEGKKIRFEDVCGWVWCCGVHLEQPMWRLWEVQNLLGPCEVNTERRD